MKKTSKYLSLGIVLVLAISIGYALIASTLEINGTASVGASSFSVIFSKIDEVQAIGATEVSAAAIDPTDSKKINFNVTLNKPGDKYTFRAFRKNNGTLNAKMDTTNGVEITGLTDPDTGADLYGKIKLRVIDEAQTYTIPVVGDTNYNKSIYHNLRPAEQTLEAGVAGDGKPVRVTLEYTTDLTPDELLDEALNLNISIKMNYVQA